MLASNPLRRVAGNRLRYAALTRFWEVLGGGCGLCDMAEMAVNERKVIGIVPWIRVTLLDILRIVDDLGCSCPGERSHCLVNIRDFEDNLSTIQM